MLELIQNSKGLDQKILNDCEKALQVLLSRTDIGFHHIPERIHLWQQALNVGRNLGQCFSRLVVVGIGGSALGTKVICEVFRNRNVLFIDNVDGDEFDNFMEDIGDIQEVGWVFVSKSGSTIETLAALEHIDLFFQKYTVEYLFFLQSLKLAFRLLYQGLQYN